MVYSAYIFFIPFFDWKSLEVVSGSVFMKNKFICLTYELELASFSHRLSHRQLFAYLWSEQYAASILHIIRTNFATVIVCNSVLRPSIGAQLVIPSNLFPTQIICLFFAFAAAFILFLFFPYVTAEQVLCFIEECLPSVRLFKKRTFSKLCCLSWNVLKCLAGVCPGKTVFKCYTLYSLICWKYKKQNSKWRIWKCS